MIRPEWIVAVVIVFAASCGSSCKDRGLRGAEDDAVIVLQEPVMCWGDRGSDLCTGDGRYMCLGMRTRRLAFCSDDDYEDCVVLDEAGTYDESLGLPVPAEMPTEP